jgi:DNA-directed RNA polymerase specialized sigma24 family protein
VGLDASVRAIARELGSSTGRVGDLLKIRDAFTETDVTFVGLFRAPEDSPHEMADEAGTRRLSQMSFRTLRTLAALPRPQRRVEARRLALGLSSRRASLMTEVPPTSEER